MSLVKQDKKEEIRVYKELIRKKGGAFRTIAWDHRNPNRIAKVLGILSEYVGNGRRRILELGCGTGSFTLPFARLNFSVVGIDLLPQFLKVVRSRCNNKTSNIPFLVAGDAEHLPFADNSFNLVFCSFVLHHFPCMSQVLSEIHRVLATDGIFFIVEPNAWNLYSWLTHVCPILYYPTCTKNEKLFGPRYIGRILRDHGFLVLNVRGINFRFFGMPRWMESQLERNSWVNCFGGSLVICAKKP